MTHKRNRLIYCIVLAVVIVAGLLSRSSHAIHLPLFVSTYAGDTLWSLALFLAIGIIFPSARLVIVACLTLLISFAVEFGQIYQADWINTIRHTRVGALALGFGFKWSDLLCYSVGCLIGVAGELLNQSTDDPATPSSTEQRPR